MSEGVGGMSEDVGGVSECRNVGVSEQCRSSVGECRTRSDSEGPCVVSEVSEVSDERTSVT